MKLSIDTGIKEYEVNENGVLRFNPSDPNVYERFVAAVDEVRQLETEYGNCTSTIDADAVDEHGFLLRGKIVLESLQKVDGRIKEILSDVFGAENDFDKLLGGVNLMAKASNGERVITNLFAALEPIIKDGVENTISEEADAAVENAKQVRFARGDKV